MRAEILEEHMHGKLLTVEDLLWIVTK